MDTAKDKLAAFDATCTTLRTHYAEWLRRERLRARHCDAMDTTWEKWLESKEGPEPPRPEKDNVARMLASACDAAQRVYGATVHERLLLTANDCADSSVSTRLNTLKSWQKRVLETLAPKLQAIIEVPMRARFCNDYPECIRMIVFGDHSMAGCAALLDGISSGTLRYCANIVTNADHLIASCDDGEFDKAWEQSWNCCIATVRHDGITF